MIQINDLPLPPLLETLILTGRWKCPDNMSLLKKLAPFEEPQMMGFLSPESMGRETAALIRLFEDDTHVKHPRNAVGKPTPSFARIYGLTRSEPRSLPINSPDLLDVRLAVAIAASLNEEGIALDYRTGLDSPRILANTWSENDGLKWRVVASDFQRFAELLNL